MQARILIVDTDRDLRGLLEEWLNTCGRVFERGEDASAGDAGAHVDLVIVDIPHPKRGCELLKTLAAEHPGTPIIALSSTFFSGIESTGGVARTLGVACVLPKPVGRESLITAVRSLLRR
jgi:DNA-binding response OmpR family regulator